MEPRNTTLIAGMLARYFRRRVLSVGPLRGTAVRALLAVLVAALGAVLSLAAYLFLRNAGVTAAVTDLVARLTSVSVVFWVLVLFAFVKVLFMKAGDMMRFTYQLPVGHRDRTAALVVFEAALVLAGAVAVFAPLATAFVALAGTGSVRLLAAGLLFPAITAYLVVALGYNLLLSVLLRAGVRRHTHLAALVFLTALIFGYDWSMPALVREISTDHLDGVSALHGVDGYVVLGDRHGPVAATALFVAACAVLVPGLLASAPNQYPQVRRFAKVPLPWGGSPVRPYAAALARRSETWVVATLVYVCAVALFVRGGDGYLYPIGLLVTQGIYAYTTTGPLREMPGYGRSAGAEVGLLLGGQVVAFVPLALPVLALAALRPQTLPTAGVVLLGSLSGILMATVVGVLFPPDRENPFSAFVSYSVLIMAMVAVVLMFGALGLPAPVLISFAALAHVLAWYYAVAGVKSLRRKARHA